VSPTHFTNPIAVAAPMNPALQAKRSMSTKRTWRGTREFMYQRRALPTKQSSWAWGVRPSR